VVSDERTVKPALAATLICLVAAVAASAAVYNVPGPGRLVDPGLVDEPSRAPYPSGRSPSSYEGCQPRTNPAPLPSVDPRGVAVGSPNPLVGARYFLDPEEPAYRAWRFLRKRGRSGSANRIWRLAREPRFRWFGRFTKPNMPRRIRQYLARARCLQPGSIPLMAVLRAEANQCRRGYLGGGLREDRATRRWYRKFAAAVGDRRVVIGFEPDSVGTLGCQARHRRDDRIRLLRYGVDVLSQLPNATIYLEATASDWEPAGRVARILRRMGIHKVRGFMLNVTHHDWTRANVRFGLDVSRQVGGKPFVINTSFNGRGPVHVRIRVGPRRRGIRRINVWCNPLRRGMGPAPTTATANPKVDAYLYINRPGYSAGSCNGGPLPVGTWWLDRALMYARNATRWLGPPRGTRYGWYRRFSRRAVGIPPEYR
jgi:endoglucanase